MNSQAITDAEFLLLGLVSEVPRHGYELEQIIEERGMREWTSIGFSSIYFVLGKLEEKQFVVSRKPAGAKARKVFSVTGAGRAVLVRQTLAALREIRPSHPSVLLGMAHWPVLDRAAAIDALRQRGNAVRTERERLKLEMARRRPLPDFVEALFDYSIRQLAAEGEWVTHTVTRMEARP